MSSTLLISYINQYGYLGLYIILGISILGLPIPDETLMVFIGFLTIKGNLHGRRLLFNLILMFCLMTGVINKLSLNFCG